MAGEEGGGLLFCFGVEDAADGVDESSARLEHRWGGVEEVMLDRFKPFEGVRGEFPFDVWVASEGAKAGAGGVDEEAVYGAVEAFDVLGRGGSGLDVVGAGAGGAASELLKMMGLGVEGDDAASVAHEGGEVQGLAAFAGAGVRGAHAGLGVEEA